MSGEATKADRLREIKDEYRNARIFGPLDVPWLIAEIEYLRSVIEDLTYRVPHPVFSTRPAAAAVAETGEEPT